MTLTWYLIRLKKMTPAEIVKRVIEHACILYSRLKYNDPVKWPYKRFAGDGVNLTFENLPGNPTEVNVCSFNIYNKIYDLKIPINWRISEMPGTRWPLKHWSRIHYWPGNPYGDIRLNWELNRLQFLPHLALKTPELALKILKDWLEHNPYLRGPSYVTSMEVAIRWISIYRSVCLMEQRLDSTIQRDVAGLAVASGKYILSRLSTHSSAGNHLIVEAVGLFWLGKALGEVRYGIQWQNIARKILWRQIPEQIHSDGTGKEQSFWYLGFVLDAVFHYLLLEDRSQVPAVFLSRIERALEFVAITVIPDGTFPDFGDRDDGYVFRTNAKYTDSFFNELLTVGSYYFERPEWDRSSPGNQNRADFCVPAVTRSSGIRPQMDRSDIAIAPEQEIRSFPKGGMTLMRWDKAQMLFRHGPLGLGNTCGHGHADALSISFFFDGIPILIDLGSGQYNGNQEIRNFFRSTAAHNTVELGNRSQAEMAGPFLWKASYESRLLTCTRNPEMTVKACHDGYKEPYHIVHEREITWKSSCEIDIVDSFPGLGGISMRGFFHLGSCERVIIEQTTVVARFPGFDVLFLFPTNFNLKVFNGSRAPFIGWRGGLYGRWHPIFSIVFSTYIEKDGSYQLSLKIEPKEF